MNNKATIEDALAWEEGDGGDLALQRKLLSSGKWGSAGDNALEILVPEYRRMARDRSQVLEVLKRVWLKLNRRIDNETYSAIGDSAWDCICNVMGTDEAIAWSDETVPDQEDVMNDQLTPLADSFYWILRSQPESLEFARSLEHQLANAKAALAACREDSAELLAERSWWKDEVRAGYRRRYEETAENIVIADSILSPQ